MQLPNYIFGNYKQLLLSVSIKGLQVVFTKCNTGLKAVFRASSTDFLGHVLFLNKFVLHVSYKTHCNCLLSPFHKYEK